MIKGECHTNLDAFRNYAWPTTFCIAPEIGQRVENLGRDSHSLKICQIIHCEKNTLPYIKIELR